MIGLPRDLREGAFGVSQHYPAQWLEQNAGYAPLHGIQFRPSQGLIHRDLLLVALGPDLLAHRETEVLREQGARDALGRFARVTLATDHLVVDPREARLAGTVAQRRQYNQFS